ncbi:hypothetical protein J3R82DRAFT_5469 [Butyriboletus roseoflavus]|nr:hypothetical protein J3R82DRAFT_5469 [Butyriboletus roseoflavus]
MTSSKPPLVGLLSLTDPQTALTDFQNARGVDSAPPPSIPNSTHSDQWTEDARIATAVSVVGGFLLGGLITVCYKVRKRSRRARARR